MRGMIQLCTLSYDGPVEEETIRGGVKLMGSPIVFTSLMQLVAYHTLNR